jgi:hypothetical protein
MEMTTLDELERLLKAGTPGPWFLSGVRFKMNGSEWHGVMSYNEAKKQDDNVCLVGYDPRTGEGHADARLIVAAINALPGLLAIRNAAKTALGHLDDPTGGDEINDMRRASDVLRAALKGT